MTAASPAYSPRELMAVELSRQLRDGEIAMTGASSEIPVAACLLAQLLHAPDFTLILPSGAVNPAPGQLYRSASDGRWFQRCEAIGSAYDLFELSENGRLDVMFYGGVQIDRYGNINLTRTGPAHQLPSFRGPGLANVSFAVVCRRILLYAAAHTPRTFVESVDYLTAPGHRPNGKRRTDLGIDTPGPAYGVTPLASFDFDSDGAMQVRSVHPGTTPDAVIDATGFPLATDRPWPTTTAPTDDELRVLRERVDPTGVLRT